jgi:polar amino acid transport system substrate-binding protein
MGVKVEYRVMAFSGIIPALIAGSVDMTPTLNVTPERAMRIDYVIPTASSVNAVIALKGTSLKTAALDELSGKTCAVKQTTQPEQMMKAMNEKLKSGKMTSQEWKVLSSSMQEISELPIFIDVKILLSYSQFSVLS